MKRIWAPPITEVQRYGAQLKCNWNTWQNNLWFLHETATYAVLSLLLGYSKWPCTCTKSIGSICHLKDDFCYYNDCNIATSRVPTQLSVSSDMELIKSGESLGIFNVEHCGGELEEAHHQFWSTGNNTNVHCSNMNSETTWWVKHPLECKSTHTVILISQVWAD